LVAFGFGSRIDPEPGGGFLPPPRSEDLTFWAMVTTMEKSTKSSQPTSFVKRLENTPEMQLPPSSLRHIALALDIRDLFSQFTGIWLSPRAMSIWVQRN
jgi:hypothetical protein